METLDRLFSEARNEAPETKLSDIQKWIVPLTVGALLAAFIAKMKVIVTLKPFIMLSSAIVAVGIGTGVVLTMNTSKEDKKERQPIVKNTIHAKTKQDPKPNEIALTEVSAKSQTQVAGGEQQPVLNMLTDWSADLAPLPNLQYCMSLPVAPIAPLQPYRLYEPVKAIQPISQITEIGDFTTLKVWGAVDVVLIQGDKASVRVEGEGDDNETCHVENKGQTLEVSSDCNNKDPKHKCNLDLTIYITFVDLKKIICSGASDISSEGKLKFDNLELEISGASDIRMDLELNKLTMISSGASDVVFSGTADKVEIISSGASDVMAEDFAIRKADVKCSGAGVIKVYVTEDLEIAASGASEVYFKGSPSHVVKTVTGESEIKNID